MKKSSFLVSVSEITEHDYESIIQSLITNVDLVWVNALAFEINPPEVNKMMHELVDAGLIKIWDYEVSMNKHSAQMVDKVLTLEDHKKNAGYLDAMMDDLVSRQLDTSSHFTTFNIEQRNMLSNLLTAKFLESESIIQRNTSRINVVTGNPDMTQAYADCLFNETNIYSLSGLSIDEILKLRKYSQYFRKKIQEKIDAHMVSGEVSFPIIRQDCKELSREYCEAVNSHLGDLTIRGMGKGLALDIASFWISPLSYYTIAQKLWDAIFHRNQRGFIMYLTTLKKSTSRIR